MLNNPLCKTEKCEQSQNLEKEADIIFMLRNVVSYRSFRQCTQMFISILSVLYVSFLTYVNCYPSGSRGYGSEAYDMCQKNE